MSILFTIMGYRRRVISPRTVTLLSSFPFSMRLLVVHVFVIIVDFGEAHFVLAYTNVTPISPLGAIDRQYDTSQHSKNFNFVPPVSNISHIPQFYYFHGIKNPHLYFGHIFFVSLAKRLVVP